MPLSSEQHLALMRVIPSAKFCEALTACPAALTIAQWALESAWGKKQPGNNCFGIKPYPGCFGTQNVGTHEFISGHMISKILPFATFGTLLDCFEKHAHLLTEVAAYEKPWAQYLIDKDVEALTKGIAPIYATDPHYAAVLIDIMHMPEVKAALQ